MLNCLLFEKFDLHYALSHFNSILLHYAKLFIRQSIDREQIFDVVFENPPPIEKFCVHHCFCVLKLSAQVTKGGSIPQFCILFYANYTILATQRGGHGIMPPLNTPLRIMWV